VIERIIRGHNNGGIFAEFIPIPHDIPNRGEWAKENWGTESDVETHELCNDELETDSPNEIRIRFDTAWSPPLRFYDHLVDIGCEVEAIYRDDSMELYGDYHNKTHRRAMMIVTNVR